MTASDDPHQERADTTPHSSTSERELEESQRAADELRRRLREAQDEIERLRAELREAGKRPGMGERVGRALGRSKAGSKDDPTGVGHG